MRNIRRRLKELSKSFPPPEDTGPELLRAAALTHLSSEDLFVLRDVVKAQESSPVRPLSELESRALETYYSALALESRGPASLELNSLETLNEIPNQNQNRTT
jgi:hypothetical protein